MPEPIHHAAHAGVPIFKSARELSNDLYPRMLDGATTECGLTSEAEGWIEVERRLQTLRQLHERNLYRPETT